MLTKSSLKTEYSRLFPAIAEEEPEEEASPTSTSPTDMTAAFQEFMTAETIDMLVFTKYFLRRHKDNTFLDI